MKKIFLDTNFIFDYLIREDYASDAEKILKWGWENGLDFYISYLTIANFAYILRKEEPASRREKIKFLTEVFKIIPGNDNQINSSLEVDCRDFEDALQYFSAISAECDCIITRNTRDFEFSTLPTLTPKEFLHQI